MKPCRHFPGLFLLLVRSLNARYVNDGATKTLNDVTNNIPGDEQVSLAYG
jgi:hypothetical protein